MDRNECITTCESRLQDKNFYKKLDRDINEDLKLSITKKIDELFAANLICKKEFKFLNEHLSSPSTPIFYGSPKIHKTFTSIPPMRPIVSGFNSCTSNLSEFIDSFFVIKRVYVNRT